MVRERMNSSDDRILAQSFKEPDSLLEELPCGVCRLSLDKDLTIRMANRFYYDTYGYTEQEAEACGFTNVRFVMISEDFERLCKTLEEKTEAGERYFELECRAIHRSGVLRWQLVRCSWNPEHPEELLYMVLDIGERREKLEQLRLTLEETRLAFQLTGKLAYTYDVKKRCLIQPSQVAELFGLPEVVEGVPDNKELLDTVASECQEEYKRFYRDMIRGLPSGSAVVKRRKKNGEFCWYEARYALCYDRNGVPEKGIIACQDVTLQHKKEQAYQKWSQYFSAKKDNCVGCYEYNLTRNCLEEIVGERETAERFRDYTETEVYIAERLIAEADRNKFYLFYDRDKMLVRYYEGQRKLSLEYRRRGVDGRFRWMRSEVLLTSDPYTGDVKLFLSLRDIDERKREELALREKVETDPLTGLLNRNALIERITEVLDRRDYSIRHVLIMLDIDHFKQLNDGYGHQFGDLVLADTARLLKEGIRRDDLCGRLGGDEFILFLSNISSEKEVEKRIGRLCMSLNRRYRGIAKVSSSMGVAFYPRDGMEFASLYRNADAALYQSKKSGRAQYTVYTEQASYVGEIAYERKTVYAVQAELSAVDQQARDTG